MSSNLKRTKVYFLVVACFMACMLVFCSYTFNITKRIYKINEADVHYRITIPKSKGDVQKINIRSIFANNVKVTNASFNHTTSQTANTIFGYERNDTFTFRVKFQSSDPNSTSLLASPASTITSITKKDDKSLDANGVYNGTNELSGLSNISEEGFNKSREFGSSPKDITIDLTTGNDTDISDMRKRIRLTNDTSSSDPHLNHGHNNTRTGARAGKYRYNGKSPDNLKHYLMKLGLPNHIVSNIALGRSSNIEGTVRPDVCKNCFKNDFKAILDEPDLCGGEVFILITISSTVSKRNTRDVIRRTWGSACNRPDTSIKCLFMFGKSKEDSENQDLVSESNKHHDVAQFDFLDTYANLTYKTMTALSWVAENCPDAVYVMKTDDDMFVNTELLPILLQAAPSENFMGGVCWGPSPPHRDKNSKWYVSFKQYTRSSFPAMCSGTGYVMSGDVIPSILTQSRNIPFFYLEDVYIALCLKKIGVRPLKLQGFYHTLVEFDPCNYRNRVITSHGLNHFDLSTIWRAAQGCGLEELTPSTLYLTRPY